MYSDASATSRCDPPASGAPHVRPTNLPAAPSGPLRAPDRTTRRSAKWLGAGGGILPARTGAIVRSLGAITSDPEPAAERGATRGRPVECFVREAPRLAHQHGDPPRKRTPPAISSCRSRCDASQSAPSSPRLRLAALRPCHVA